MGIEVGFFVTDDGMVIEQFSENDAISLEEILIMPTTKGCDNKNISRINSYATDVLIPYYEGDILLAEHCFDMYLDVLAEIGNLDPYWFFDLENRFTGF